MLLIVQQIMQFCSGSNSVLSAEDQVFVEQRYFKITFRSLRRKFNESYTNQLEFYTGRVLKSVMKFSSHKRNFNVNQKSPLMLD